MGSLQQLTSEKRVLYESIERVKYNALGRVGAGAFAPLGPLRRCNDSRCSPTVARRLRKSWANDSCIAPAPEQPASPGLVETTASGRMAWTSVICPGY